MAAPKPSAQKPKGKKPEPLDWRGLASGPALRGLNDVLGGGTPTVVESVPVVFQEIPTDPVSTTVGYTSHWVAPEPPWVDGNGGLHEARRVQAVLAAEHSMTMGEERFYQSVWNASDDVQVESPDSRTFTLGYDRLAKLVRLDEKSVRQLIPKLVFKRILEVMAGENSSARIGRTYRIFAATEILRRQRSAGLQHIVKKGRAVEFVWPSGQHPPSMPVSPTVGAWTSGETWSAAVDAALRVFGITPDPAMVRSLVANCRRTAADASNEEIVYFIHERGQVLRNRSVSNPMAYLLVSVASCFEPERLSKYREQTRKAATNTLVTAQQAEQELRAMRKEWEGWLKDPGVSVQDRQWAKEMLSRIP